MGRTTDNGCGESCPPRCREKNAPDAKVCRSSCSPNDFAGLSRPRKRGDFGKRDSRLIEMSSRLKLTVAYDGAAFAGWQSQAHRNTVQDELERALQKISGHRIRVHGAGRTDAGVHALAQCAHVDLPDKRMSIERWRNALNAVLPAAVRVLRCQYVSQKFHARFSATGKLYR